MITDPHQRAKTIAAADRQVNRRTLRPLKDLGLVTVVRPFLRGETTPLAQKEVVVLTARGAEVVRQLLAAADRTGSARWRANWLDIDGTNQAHASLISDTYIALRRATGDRWKLRGWRDDRDLAQLTQQGQTTLNGLIPDAAFVLANRDAYYPLFLEIDLGTESVLSPRHSTRDVAAKFERYRSYLIGHWQRDPLLEGIERRPHVLFLTTSARRLENLHAAAERVGVADAVHFSTIDRLVGDIAPHATIWELPWLSGPSGQRQGLAEFLDVQPRSLRSDVANDQPYDED
jgi:hypothetical protein